MTLSRKAALPFAVLLPLLAPSPASAQALTAEEAEANYRSTFSIATAAPDCPEEEGEIIVCARRDNQRHRLPLPVESVAGAHLVGEMPRASGERGQAGTERCSTVGANQQCSGGLPIIPIAVMAVKAVEKLVEGDD